MGNSNSSNSGGARGGTAAAADQNSPEYWRARGDALAQARNTAFSDSKAAWSSGDRARAHQLSQQGKGYAAESERAHARAAALYLQHNNAQRPLGELDLHGLRVKEAIAEVEKAVARGRAAGLPKLVLIVGKGLHSADGVPRLRPAIEGLVMRHNLRVTPGLPNAGCITVEFVSKKERGWVGWLADAAGCVIC